MDQDRNSIYPGSRGDRNAGIPALCEYRVRHKNQKMPKRLEKSYGNFENIEKIKRRKIPAHLSALNFFHGDKFFFHSLPFQFSVRSQKKKFDIILLPCLFSKLLCHGNDGKNVSSRSAAR